jgi:hypothetical protein
MKIGTHDFGQRLALLGRIEHFSRRETDGTQATFGTLKMQAVAFIRLREAPPLPLSVQYISNYLAVISIAIE